VAVRARPAATRPPVVATGATPHAGGYLPSMLQGRRSRTWDREVVPLVEELHAALVDLIADIGEPGAVVLAACAALDRRITETDRWMLRTPCPDPRLERALRDLVGACAGLWATTVAVAHRTPAGIDAGVGHLPSSCTVQMAERVDALEQAIEGARRLQLL